LQYNGTNYNGWQIQALNVERQASSVKDWKSIITIQGLIQEAIKKITGENAKVIGAGRTDAGVHAIAQVASFKTSSKLRANVIKRALNANLPDDIKILDACDAELDFHPRYDAKSKVYFYIISNSPIISPFLYRYAWRVPQRLNFEDMRNSIESFKGRHDFSSFRASGCSAKNPVRTIYKITMQRLGTIDFMGIGITGDFLKLRIEANAFLRHMVRNIIGTLVKIGEGKIHPSDIEKILQLKNRNLAGTTAPSRGLFLEKINY
jgi:tRNA pseudouridine38-40 synthase